MIKHFRVFEKNQKIKMIKSCYILEIKDIDKNLKKITLK